MNPATMLTEMQNKIPKGNGAGFLRTVKLNPPADFRTAAGLVLTGVTAPLVAMLETNAMGVQAAAGSNVLGSFTFQVPLDYDYTADYLKLNLLVNSAGNTDSPTIGATVYSKRAGVALSVDKAPTASAAIPKSATPATAAAVRTVTISLKSFQPGDQLTINLTTGAHATDAVNLYGAALVYKSTLVAADSASR